jgi:hypothetical protein
MSMINHVVVVRFNEDATAALRAELVRSIGALSEAGLATTMQFGEDAGLGTGNNADLALVATFEDADGLSAYLKHEAHVGVVGQLRPLAADLAIVQFES